MSVSLPIAGGTESYALRPSKIIALGLNYMEHVKEHYEQFEPGARGPDAAAVPPPETPPEPILFAKTPNVLIGPGEPIVIPAFLQEYGFEETRTDYEAELAVIIGRQCRHVAEERALEHVFGYTCMNDVSQRNLQRGDKSGWFRGKSLDGFGPVGPRIVPAREIPDPQSLTLRCRLNGEVVQESSTELMIFSVARTIAFISRQISLEPGDIISTGTPRGVGPLHHGDVVEVEIEGIGTLRNPVIEESAQS
jgi:2-keto-4-pentenoate hydratase/2-oxohepta-3-ene-1,7-dioic acid hydratase in catechol pathway